MPLTHTVRGATRRDTVEREHVVRVDMLDCVRRVARVRDVANRPAYAALLRRMRRDVEETARLLERIPSE
jgi:hypothetical protein